MEIDLRQVWRGARRWWWILALVPAVFGSLAFAYTARQQPMYEASAKLFVNPSGTGQLDYNTILSAERLTKTYQRLVKDREVLTAAVAANPDLGLTVEQLDRIVTATAESNTQLLIVTAADTDPVRAAAVANGVAEAFAAYVKERSTSSGGQSLEQLEQAFSGVDKQIADTTAQIAALQSGPNAADPATATRIAALQASLDTLRPTYASLLASMADAKARAAVTVDQVTLSGAAYPPDGPYAPNRTVNVLLGIIFGLIVAGGAVALLDYLDNTVKATTDFAQVSGAPLLSTVMSVPNVTSGAKQLFVLEQPKSAAAESIRLLRTNVEFASAASEIATIGITSAHPGEGKSTIASNLAITLAQAGFVTALIDADLRRPSQHRIFGESNDRGISSLLTYPDKPWSWAARETAVPNLTMIPSGPLPPNPADLLSLDRLRNLLTELRQTFDVIVIDTPPVLAVSDPLIVAAHVDGMIVVALGGKTRLDALKRAAATLHAGAIRIVGVVVNQQSGKAEGGYYYDAYNAVEDRPLTAFRRRSSPAPAQSLPALDQTSSAD